MGLSVQQRILGLTQAQQNSVVWGDSNGTARAKKIVNGENAALAENSFQYMTKSTYNGKLDLDSGLAFATSMLNAYRDSTGKVTTAALANATNPLYDVNNTLQTPKIGQTVANAVDLNSDSQISSKEYLSYLELQDMADGVFDGTVARKRGNIAGKTNVMVTDGAAYANQMIEANPSYNKGTMQTIYNGNEAILNGTKTNNTLTSSRAELAAAKKLIDKTIDRSIKTMA